DVHAGNPRVVARAFQELRRQVQAGHPGSQPGGSDGHHSGAARDVEDALPRARTRATDELSRGLRGDGLERGKVRPAFPLRFFETRQWTGAGRLVGFSCEVLHHILLSKVQDWSFDKGAKAHALKFRAVRPLPVTTASVGEHGGLLRLPAS